MNEEQNMLRQKSEQRLMILNIIGMAIVGTLAVAGFVLANLWASGKQTEDTYEIMYTVAIAFGFDVLLVQAIFAVVQLLLVKYVGTTQMDSDSRLRRFLRMLISREMAMVHGS